MKWIPPYHIEIQKYYSSQSEKIHRILGSEIQQETQKEKINKKK